mmetsp:Transcript_3105/g.10171  ORF Transcript_3105/g.10171 Transcript_3105/m.10171 type:complete len:210 (-) Transcript_3105:854-1483(-)
MAVTPSPSQVQRACGWTSRAATGEVATARCTTSFRFPWTSSRPLRQLRQATHSSTAPHCARTYSPFRRRCRRRGLLLVPPPRSSRPRLRCGTAAVRLPIASPSRCPSLALVRGPSSVCGLLSTATGPPRTTLLPSWTLLPPFACVHPRTPLPPTSPSASLASSPPSRLTRTIATPSTRTLAVASCRLALLPSSTLTRQPSCCSSCRPPR